MNPFWRKKSDVGVEEVPKNDAGTAEVSGEVSFQLSQLEFNDGTTINLKQDELMVVVGPNNVGKTATLVGILQRLYGQNAVILRGLKTVRTGGENGVHDWLGRNFKADPDCGDNYRTRRGFLSPRDVGDEWKKNDALGALTDFFCRVVTTEERLAASMPADNLDVLTEPCRKPIQALAVNNEIETQLSDASVQAFGIPLFLDRWSGKNSASGAVKYLRTSRGRWRF